MLNVYDLIKFDNVDGGAWKQGWKVEIDSSRFTSEDKLKVFVIPHSHNDPGKVLETFGNVLNSWNVEFLLKSCFNYFQGG